MQRLSRNKAQISHRKFQAFRIIQRDAQRFAAAVQQVLDVCAHVHVQFVVGINRHVCRQVGHALHDELPAAAAAVQRSV